MQRAIAFEPTALAEIALNSAVGATVGLVVGLVAFPFRWWIQHVIQVRRENVTAYRTALRLIRSAEFRNDCPESRHTWTEAQHVLEESRDETTHDLVAKIADLWHRGDAAVHLYGPDAADSHRPELAGMARKALLHRLRHQFRRAPDLTPRLLDIEHEIESAESELYEQHKHGMAAYSAWLRERDTAA